MRRGKSLDSLKSFFICVSAVWGQSPVFHHREWLQPDPSIVFLPGCPGELESLMTVTSLFIDMARNTPFLTPDPQKEMFSPKHNHIAVTFESPSMAATGRTKPVTT